VNRDLIFRPVLAHEKTEDYVLSQVLELASRIRPYSLQFTAETSQVAGNLRIFLSIQFHLCDIKYCMIYDVTDVILIHGEINS